MSSLLYDNTILCSLTAYITNYACSAVYSLIVKIFQYSNLLYILDWQI